MNSGLFLNPDALAFELISEIVRERVKEKISDLANGILNEELRSRVKDILIKVRESVVEEYKVDGEDIKFAVKVADSNFLVIDTPQFLYKREGLTFLGNTFNNRRLDIDCYYFKYKKRCYVIARYGNEKGAYDIMRVDRKPLEHQNGLRMAKSFFEYRKNILSF